MRNRNALVNSTAIPNTKWQLDHGPVPATKAERAFAAADAYRGITPYQPTQIEVATHFGVSPSYLHWALKREAERAAILAGQLPLVPPAPAPMPVQVRPSMPAPLQSAPAPALVPAAPAPQPNAVSRLAELTREADIDTALELLANLERRLLEKKATVISTIPIAPAAGSINGSGNSAAVHPAS
jgi:hypothetical protein